MNDKLKLLTVGFLVALTLAATVEPALKISQYPNVAVPNGNDLFILASGSTNKNIRYNQLKPAIIAGLVTSNQIVEVITNTVFVRPGTTNVTVGTNVTGGKSVFTVSVTTPDTSAYSVFTNDGTFIFPKDTYPSNSAPEMFRSDGSLFSGSNVWKDIDISDTSIFSPSYSFETNRNDLHAGMTLADTEDYNYYSFLDITALKDSGGSGHFSLTFSSSDNSGNFSSWDWSARRSSIIQLRDSTGSPLIIRPQHNTVGEAPYVFGSSFSQTGDFAQFSNALVRIGSISNNGDMHIAGRYQETMPGSGSIVAVDSDGAHYRTNVTSGTSGTNFDSIRVTNQVRYVPQDFNGSNGTSGLTLTNNFDLTLNTFRHTTNVIGTNQVYHLSNLVAGCSFVHIMYGGPLPRTVSYRIPGGGTGTNIWWYSTTNGTFDFTANPGISYTVAGFVDSQTNVVMNLNASEYIPFTFASGTSLVVSNLTATNFQTIFIYAVNGGISNLNATNFTFSFLSGSNGVFLKLWGSNLFANTLTITNQVSYVLSTNTPVTGTSYVADFNQSYVKIFAGGDLAFIHSTNREALWKNLVFKIYSGASQRTLTLNTNWTVLGGTNTTILAANRIAILSLAQDGLQETNVCAVISTNAVVPGQ